MHLSYTLKHKESVTLCISIQRTYLEKSKDPEFANDKQVYRWTWQEHTNLIVNLKPAILLVVSQPYIREVR